MRASTVISLVLPTVLPFFVPAFAAGQKLPPQVQEVLAGEGCPSRNTAVLAKLPASAPLPAAALQRVAAIRDRARDSESPKGLAGLDAATAKAQPRDLAQLGPVLFIQHLDNAAAYELAKAVLADPSDVNSWNNLGAVLTRLGEADAAVPVLLRTLALAPGNSTVLTNLGVAYFKLGAIDRAEPLLQQAVKAEPKQLAANYALGKIARCRKQPEQAATFFRRGLEGEEFSGDMVTDLVEVEEELKEAAEAAGTARKQAPPRRPPMPPPPVPLTLDRMQFVFPRIPEDAFELLEMRPVLKARSMEIRRQFSACLTEAQPFMMTQAQRSREGSGPAAPSTYRRSDAKGKAALRFLNQFYGEDDGILNQEWHKFVDQWVERADDNNKKVGAVYNEGLKREEACGSDSACFRRVQAETCEAMKNTYRPFYQGGRAALMGLYEQSARDLTTWNDEAIRWGVNEIQDSVERKIADAMDRRFRLLSSYGSAYGSWYILTPPVELAQIVCKAAAAAPPVEPPTTLEAAKGGGGCSTPGYKFNVLIGTVGIDCHEISISAGEGIVGELRLNPHDGSGSMYIGVGGSLPPLMVSGNVGGFVNFDGDGSLAGAGFGAGGSLGPNLPVGPNIAAGADWRMTIVGRP